MRIVQVASEVVRQPGKVNLAIGFFDGVHLGHQQIIRQTIIDARQHNALALVVTFDRHPNTVVAPGRVPQLIYSPAQKLRTIARLGADAALVLAFDRAFSEQQGEDFIRSLKSDLGQIQSICVGANFTFGHKRSGNVAVLKKLGADLGFLMHGMAAVSLDGRAVSSTRIREAIQKGQLDAASQMLGRAYALTGKVQRGDGLGRKLGFPTANLDTTGLVLPPEGVYAVQAMVHGRAHRAVLNLGRRPTLQQTEPRLQVETHLIGFTGDLYDQELEIVVVEKLRDEQKFAALADLQAQIARDIEEALKRL